MLSLVSSWVASWVASWVVISALMLAPLGPRSAVAAPKKDAKTEKPAPAASGAHKVNACGCYQDSTGVCFCSKKAKGKCVCPGECEPKGCDEKRAKDIEREIKSETKRAQESDRKQKAASKKSAAGSADEDQKSAAKKEKEKK